jgi:hypothetical protein
MSKNAMTAATNGFNTIPAATGTVPGARRWLVLPGWRNGRANCCPSGIFTLPHELGPLALQNKRVVYGILFRAAAQTLLEIAADPQHLGAKIGCLMVLHTRGANLMHHPHGHFPQFRHFMKPVMPHRPTKNSSAQAVTHPLRADLAPLDLFSSIGRLNPYAASNPAMHGHHIPHSSELSLIASIHSGSRRELRFHLQSP